MLVTHICEHTCQKYFLSVIDSEFEVCSSNIASKCRFAVLFSVFRIEHFLRQIESVISSVARLT